MSGQKGQGETGTAAQVYLVSGCCICKCNSLQCWSEAARQQDNCWVLAEVCTPPPPWFQAPADPSNKGVLLTQG